MHDSDYSEGYWQLETCGGRYQDEFDPYERAMARTSELAGHPTHGSVRTRPGTTSNPSNYPAVTCPRDTSSDCHFCYVRLARTS